MKKKKFFLGMNHSIIRIFINLIWLGSQYTQYSENNQRALIKCPHLYKQILVEHIQKKKHYMKFKITLSQ